MLTNITVAVIKNIEIRINLVVPWLVPDDIAGSRTAPKSGSSMDVITGSSPMFIVSTLSNAANY